MITVFYVRHAHSPWIPNSEAERPFSERGRRDADLLADCDVDAVVSTPYARAVEIVRPVADVTDWT